MQGMCEGRNELPSSCGQAAEEFLSHYQKDLVIVDLEEEHTHTDVEL